MTVTTPPTARTPQPMPPSAGNSAPTRASTCSPADASAFITTSIQSPSAGSQVSCWVPDPETDAVQKSCSARGPDGAPPDRSSAAVAGAPKAWCAPPERCTEPAEAVVAAAGADPADASAGFGPVELT